MDKKQKTYHACVWLVLDRTTNWKSLKMASILRPLPSDTITSPWHHHSILQSFHFWQCRIKITLFFEPLRIPLSMAVTRSILPSIMHRSPETSISDSSGKRGHLNTVFHRSRFTVWTVLKHWVYQAGLRTINEEWKIRWSLYLWKRSTLPEKMAGGLDMGIRLSSN